MSEQPAVTTRAGWHRRSKLTKTVIVALVAVSALLLPAAGSFVPRDNGNVIFGGEAQAACKEALGNYFDEWWFKASVLTNWCYDGNSVTSRHSEAGGNVTDWGAVAGWFLIDQHWEYSDCHFYNGIYNHNCLTQREFNLFNGHVGEPKSICIGTRIYGGGGHHRNITQAQFDACPA